MYRSASRYEARPIPDKPSRSARSIWIESQHNCPYALDDDERGLSRDPCMTDDAVVSDKDFQHSKSTSGGTDLTEAQRLAASFFSQYSAASIAPPPVNRDAARSSRTLSPEVPMERYSARGQYRDRDVGGIERWGDRSNLESLYPPYRSQLVLEDREEERIPLESSRREPMDLCGVLASRGKKRDDGGWDYAAGYVYDVVRKDADYSHIQATADLEGGLRVIERVDWTCLLRPDGSITEDGIGLDSSMGKRQTNQIYRFGRPYVNSYRNGLEDELDEASLRTHRAGRNFGSERYRDSEARQEWRHLDGRLPYRQEYPLDRSLGIGDGGRGGARGRDDSRTDRQTGARREHRLSESDRGRDKSPYEERDSRRPFCFSSNRYSGGGSGLGPGRDLADGSSHFGKGRVGRHGAVKRDFSQRASITNQDILAVYYGNQGPSNQASSFINPRNFPYSGPSRCNDDSAAPPTSERYRLRRSSRSPRRGRLRRYNPNFGPSRKGRKRWEKPAAEGSYGKSFKRETQSDKLYLMHNSKATTDEKKDETAASAGFTSERETAATKAKEKISEGEAEPPAVEDAHEEKTVVDTVDKSDGLWENGESWSDSEEEKHEQLTWGDPASADEGEATGEERKQATFQALQSGAVSDSKKFLGECSEDDADWESLASDLDDHLDDVCVHQCLADAVTESPDREVALPTASEAQASEVITKLGPLSVAQSQDSEMVDIEDAERSEEGKEAPQVDISVEEGREGCEKKVVVFMEELQESVRNREDNAFDYYVSLFEQDTGLMKLYEANVNCGSFECLVCAGVGAKKRKRFPDVASVVQHAKKILRTEKLPEHRGFGRAVCNMLGWETVPGLQIIRPYVCIPPQQSEPKLLTSGASDKQQEKATVKLLSGPTWTHKLLQDAFNCYISPCINVKKGFGEGGAGMDWEWATARQLFEEQETRIDDATGSSIKLLQTESFTTARRLQSEGKNYDSVEGAADLVTFVETIVTREKPTVTEKATAEVFSVQGKATLVDVGSESDEVPVGG